MSDGPARGETKEPPEAVAQTFPLWPLLATLGVQTLATMAAYTVPALAPEIAKDLGVDGSLTGYFVAMVYGVGIVSSLLAPAFIHARGAVRASQGVLLATVGMLVVASGGTLGMLALSAAVLGLAYGATAPSSVHLLVPLTPPRIFNFVMSLRQIGVPLGGVLGALSMPPLALAIGWRNALLVQVVPVVLLMFLIELPRRRWDGARPVHPAGTRRPSRLAPLLLLFREDARIRRLVLASFVYSGMQLCFVAFTTSHLTSKADFTLIAAGQALATYQISGAISRPIWGWLADRVFTAAGLLALHGIVMALAAFTAGQFSAAWSPWLILLVCVIAGATASGYTGLAYAEFARLAGSKRTEATGLGSASMFAGVMILPSLGSLLVTVLGNYAVGYAVVGTMAGLCGILLAVRRL